MSEPPFSMIPDDDMPDDPFVLPPPVPPPDDLPPGTLVTGDIGFMVEPATTPLWMPDGTLVMPEEA